MRKAAAKLKLSRLEYAERFAAEKALQQRRYCDATQAVPPETTLRRRC